MDTHGCTNWQSDFLSGAIGGIAGIAVGHPFDTTKVQLQTQVDSKRYKGTVDAIISIQHHGLRQGFFRGLSYPLLTCGGVNAVLFGVYGNALRILANGRTPDSKDVFFAGCAGGLAQFIIGCPIEVIKCNMQAQIPHWKGICQTTHSTTSRHLYRRPQECLREIWRRQGAPGLYRGWGAMILRDVPSYGLHLVLYQSISSSLRSSGSTDYTGVTADVIGGGLAGTISWLSVMPFDVVKSRLQTDLQGKYRGAIDCALWSWRQEGICVFYRGTLVTCIRAFLVNAVTFLVYRQTMKYLNTGASHG